uniref:Uncharacterized protein n=1 Tax=Ursus maritimus TaxID=29073 RepID=A0A452V6A0_URSMA
MARGASWPRDARATQSLPACESICRFLLAPKPSPSICRFLCPHQPDCRARPTCVVSRALRRAGRCLAKPRAEPADAQATCLCLDRRLELVILPNEPHQLLQLLVLPHQPLDLMPKALIIDAGERRCSWDP